MKPMLMSRAARRFMSLRQQAGVALVEFALVALIFLTILIGIMEFGRWLFTLNAAAEATRWGARLAVVCGSSDAQINAYVAVMLRSGNGSITTVRDPAACATADCLVTAKLVGATFTPLIPLLGGTYAIPNFTTSLPREALGSAGPATDVCP